VRVIRGLEAVQVRRPLCLAMGVFDGVHVGHQRIISAAVRMAASAGGQPAVLTFDPHPDAILSPQGPPPLLTTTTEKLALISSLGISLVVLARFDQALAEMPAETFARRVLAEQLQARCLVVGEGWRFGRQGEGSIHLLQRMAPQLGFRVAAVRHVARGRRVVSSTWIRRLLSQGRADAAQRCLGRHYGLTGRVVPGDGRGRQLGYPTANLDPPADKLIPGDGVYACWAGVRRLRPAACSIGVRPTFSASGERRVEVHVLGTKRLDLLGRTLRVAFVQRLRGERRFASQQALVRQMARDCAETEQRLALQSPPVLV